MNLTKKIVVRTAVQGVSAVFGLAGLAICGLALFGLLLVALEARSVGALALFATLIVFSGCFSIGAIFGLIAYRVIWQYSLRSVKNFCLLLAIFLFFSISALAQEFKPIHEYGDLHHMAVTMSDDEFKALNLSMIFYILAFLMPLLINRAAKKFIVKATDLDEPPPLPRVQAACEDA